jgi:hypothetical protein
VVAAEVKMLVVVVVVVVIAQERLFPLPEELNTQSRLVVAAPEIQ